MELTESARFHFMQVFLWAPADLHPCWPVLAESWDWFRLRYDPFLERCARRLWWVEREERESELWLFLVPRLRRFPYHPERAPLDACIAMLVRHAIADARRAHAARRLGPRAEELPDDLTGPGEGPHATLEAREQAYRVRAAIAALRARGEHEDTRLLERHWFEHATLAAIAVELGLPAAQVRFRHRRACAKLRAELMRGGGRDLVPHAAGANAPSEK